MLRGWFHDNARDAWTRARRSLVVVPTRPYANALKARLLEEGISHLGLHFVTPGVLRELLRRAVDAEQPLSSREDLQLLLAIAAEEMLATGTAGGELNDVAQTAKAVLRAPDHLFRTLERLQASGWSFDDLQLRSFQPIVHRFRGHLESAGLQLAAEFDRTVRQRGATKPPLFSKVLITGFDGAHWPHWFLLRAAARSAEGATVLLEYPLADIDADSCWIGSWEEAFGEAIDVSSNSNGSSDTFFTAEEMRGLGRAKSECVFLVGANTAEQAEAVARQCLRFLAEPNCTRIGAVFAGGGSLPRLVGSAFAKLEIEHHDGIGHPIPGLFESVEWRAWLQLQQGPRINSLLHFINSLPGRAELFPGLSSHAFERTLRSAYADVLLDDLAILQQFCSEQSEPASQAAAEAIRSVHLLPARATLSDFLGQTEAAFKRLQWKTHWMEVSCRLGEWTKTHELEFSRTLYLRWLGEIASTSAISRAPVADHPYARVQLLTLPQAHGQEWSHLIFAGWNEGSWPPPASGEFARDEEIAAFNRGIRHLNRRAARQGRQGEGHSAVRDDHSLYLGPAEQRAIALRQFDALAKSAVTAIAFSANLAQENAPERFWNPSELFTRWYQQTHRQPLTQPTMASLERATAAWLDHAGTLTKQAELPSIQVEQTRVAFDARRDPATSAGEYDFALRSPPPHMPVLRVTEMEKLVSTPALIWLKKFLGVEAADEGGRAWHAATGLWVHHWLAQIGAAEGSKVFAPLPTRLQLDERVRRAASQKTRDVKRLCAAAGKTLPDWWMSGWQNALHLARHLGSKIATAQEWPWMASEWTIDASQPVEIAPGVTLSLRGRIDLLLARSESAAEAETNELWIIDYKTGSNKPLVPAREDVEKRKTRLHNRIVKGEALQLGLYALAMRERGASDVFLSIVSPAVRSVAPQLSITDIAAHGEIFVELARMQQTGVFGMLGRLRPAFGYARPYPLATLAVDPDLLDAKWELTHPALAREEDEWESW